MVVCVILPLFIVIIIDHQILHIDQILEIESQTKRFLENVQFENLLNYNQDATGL